MCRHSGNEMKTELVEAIARARNSPLRDHSLPHFSTSGARAAGPPESSFYRSALFYAAAAAAPFRSLSLYTMSFFSSLFRGPVLPSEKTRARERVEGRRILLPSSVYISRPRARAIRDRIIHSSFHASIIISLAGASISFGAQISPITPAPLFSSSAVMT